MSWVLSLFLMLSESDTNITRYSTEIIKIVNSKKIDNFDPKLNLRYKAILTHIKYIVANKDNKSLTVSAREELLFIKSTCEDILEKEENKDVKRILELCKKLDSEFLYKELYE